MARPGHCSIVPWMTQSRCIASALALTLSAGAAMADERKLDAAEIAALLTGNTALGENRGRPTRQSFQANGITFYLEKDAPPTRGRWRVDEARGKYCSLWAMGGWSCYDVTTNGESGEAALYHWSLPGSDYHSPFTMLPGEHLKF